MVIRPSPFASPATHPDTGAVPNAMFTMVISSFTLTVWLPSQSPTQMGIPGVEVRITVAVGVLAD